MPKHISLGMTVRHITGSATLIGLLNGLGHCTSSSMVSEHDTALAELQRRKGPVAIPSCIRPGVFTMLVWDNNDFGEETLSGKETTHNTNGIIMERGCGITDIAVSGRLKCSKKRSFQPPNTDLIQF